MPTWPWRKPRPEVDEYGRSPLWYHAMHGRLADVQRQLARGGDPTPPDKDGFSALHVAAEYNHRAVVQALIAAGADVNCTDKYGNAPLWVGTRKVQTPGYDSGIVEDLLKAGADFNHRNKTGKLASGWAFASQEAQEHYRAAGYDGPFEF